MDLSSEPFCRRKDGESLPPSQITVPSGRVTYRTPVTKPTEGTAQAVPPGIERSADCVKMSKYSKAAPATVCGR